MQRYASRGCKQELDTGLVSCRLATPHSPRTGLPVFGSTKPAQEPITTATVERHIEALALYLSPSQASRSGASCRCSRLLSSSCCFEERYLSTRGRTLPRLNTQTPALQRNPLNRIPQVSLLPPPLAFPSDCRNLFAGANSKYQPHTLDVAPHFRA